MSSGGAAVIVEDRDGRVLLLLRGPGEAWMPYRWDLPGGGVDRGETSIEAAVREAREEAGLQVHALSLFTRARYRGKTYDVFYARSWSGDVRLNDEHVSYAWVPREELGDWDVIPVQRGPLRQLARL